MSKKEKQPRRYSISSRPSKVKVSDLALPHKPGGDMRDFISSLPRQLAAVELRDAVKAIVKARGKKRPVIVGFGGHVIKVGLGPILIDLIEKDIITALATNGAGLIHDFELAKAGKTSEDVDSTLGEGTFGFASETGRIINECAKYAANEGTGVGKAVGAWLNEKKPRNLAVSVFGAAYRKNIPITVHVALGTDIVHMHPEADGACWGKTTMTDFKTFSDGVAELEGGVYLNLGSAVILPEVFLKAVTLARNTGKKLRRITTIDVDFLRQYRSQTNVVRRPTAEGGRGISLTGHHELVVPLLAAAVLEEMSGGFIK